MFVVFITRGYPSKNHLQNGIFEAIQAHALKKLGHKVIIIGVNCYSIKNYDILGSHHRIEDGIEIFEDYSLAIPSHNRMPFVWQSKILSKKIRKYLNLIIKEHGKPDVIHSHYLLMTSAVSRIIPEYNIPLVCTEHWSRINSNLLPQSTLEDGKRAYDKVDRILAVSNQTSKSILEKFDKKSNVVYNMVHDTYFDSKKKCYLNNEFTFISIGTMSNNRKGFDILLKAFAKFLASGENGILNIIGQGVLLNQYKELAKKLGINDKVEFIPEMNREELSDYISHSHVVVMSSRIETFGVVLIEGMAKGKPVIATRCGGPEDFITSEMGILVPTEDIDELCNAMIRMKKSYSEYNQEKIKNLCYDNYSQKRIAEKIIDVYSSAIQHHGN